MYYDPNLTSGAGGPHISGKPTLPQTHLPYAPALYTLWGHLTLFLSSFCGCYSGAYGWSGCVHGPRCLDAHQLPGRQEPPGRQVPPLTKLPHRYDTIIHHNTQKRGKEEGDGLTLLSSCIGVSAINAIAGVLYIYWRCTRSMTGVMGRSVSTYTSIAYTHDLSLLSQPLCTWVLTPLSVLCLMMCPPVGSRGCF